jgi:hypothetical protein
MKFVIITTKIIMSFFLLVLFAIGAFAETNSVALRLQQLSDKPRRPVSNIKTDSVVVNMNSKLVNKRYFQKDNMRYLLKRRTANVVSDKTKTVPQCSGAMLEHLCRTAPIEWRPKNCDLDTQSLETSVKTLPPRGRTRRLQEGEGEGEGECGYDCGDSSVILSQIDCRAMDENDCTLFEGICKWEHFLFDDESDCNYTPKCYEVDYAPLKPYCKTWKTPDPEGEGPEYEQITQENCVAGFIPREQGQDYPRVMCDATKYTPYYDGGGNAPWWQKNWFLNARNSYLHICEWRNDKNRCAPVNGPQYN